MSKCKKAVIENIVVTFLIVIVLIYGAIAVQTYKERAVDRERKSIKYVGYNDDYYYVLKNKNTKEFVNNFENVKLIAYDKNNDIKQEYKLNFSSEEYPMVIDNANGLSNWILINDAENQKIMGINTENNETNILLDKTDVEDEVFKIVSYKIYDDKIVYAYHNWKDKTVIAVKDINTKKVVKLLELNEACQNIPLSIYEEKVAYLVDYKLYIQDIDTKEIINSGTDFTGPLEIYKDKVYTCKKEEAGLNFVQVDFHLNTNIILSNANSNEKVYLDNGKIVYRNYFYDAEQEKLYKLNEYNSRLKKQVIGDRIYTEVNEYEVMKINENYFEQSLGENIIYKQ